MAPVGLAEEGLVAFWVRGYPAVFVCARNQITTTLPIEGWHNIYGEVREGNRDRLSVAAYLRRSRIRLEQDSPYPIKQRGLACRREVRRVQNRKHIDIGL